MIENRTLRGLPVEDSYAYLTHWWIMDGCPKGWTVERLANLSMISTSEMKDVINAYIDGDLDGVLMKVEPSSLKRIFDSEKTANAANSKLLDESYIKRNSKQSQIAVDALVIADRITLWIRSKF